MYNIRYGNGLTQRTCAGCHLLVSMAMCMTVECVSHSYLHTLFTPIDVHPHVGYAPIKIKIKIAFSSVSSVPGTPPPSLKCLGSRLLLVVPLSCIMYAWRSWYVLQCGSGVVMPVGHAPGCRRPRITDDFGPGFSMFS